MLRLWAGFPWADFTDIPMGNTSDYTTSVKSGNRSTVQGCLNGPKTQEGKTNPRTGS